jgi:amino acid transporter
VSVLDLLLGRRLANREQSERKLGAFTGVAAMGLDGLASAAYGPEAALAVLIPLGLAGPAWLLPIMGVILCLLFILFVSYRQTIAAYPSNGGAYTVCKENLGRAASLLAATALMLDYVLNVAVAISAGVAAVVSAVPAAQPFTLPLCLAVLGLLTLVNLRGTLDTGRLFAAPTYLFVAGLLITLAIGAWRVRSGAGPVVAPPRLPGGTETVSLWIVARAFASGCTAMTGVEAVSNGVSAFKPPVRVHAHRTLTLIVLILGILLAGVAFLAHAFDIGAMDQTQPGYRSVLSQLAAASVGVNGFYYFVMATILAVLCLSANTSFVGFPRLCHRVAQDGFLPRAFVPAGRRLVFSFGIVYLAVTAGLLLTVFGGITDRLIPLFAVGAFSAFTLSQLGMTLHWHRVMRRADGSTRWNHVRRAINGVGAATTGAALIVILVAKFAEGAWITVAVVPCAMALLVSVRHYYDRVDARRARKPGPVTLLGNQAPSVIILIEDWNSLTDRAITLALSISDDVLAVHIDELEGPDTADHDEALRRNWRDFVEAPATAAGIRPPRLRTLRAAYREYRQPLTALIQEVETASPARPVAVLIPELVKQHWWQHLLHINRARGFRAAILALEDPKIVVVNVPWFLEPARQACASAADRPAGAIAIAPEKPAASLADGLRRGK